MFLIGTLTLIYYVSYRIYQYFFPPPDIDPDGKYVLISGCDTGFGRGLAVELDRQGFNVLVGVLNENSVTSLKNELSGRATVLQLDITKQEAIDAAYELIQKKTNTLHALVNNAGISVGGYIDWTPLELTRKVMEVNFYGHVAMTKKFLPLLIAKRHSRVINVSSINGFLSVPARSSYCASKYALEGFSDCLRREMFSWGLHVSIIEPAAMRTEIIKGESDQWRKLWDQLPSDVQKRWGIKFLNNSILQLTTDPMIVNAENPYKVIRAMKHAIMNPNPRIRYRPGLQVKFFYVLNKILPTWIQDKIFRKMSNLIPDGIRHQLID